MTVLEDRRPCSARACITGMRTRTIGVLLLTPLNTMVSSSVMAMASWPLPRARRRMSRAIRRSAPVRASPWPITSMQSTVMSAGSAKPESRRTASSRFAPAASATGNRWKRTRRTAIAPADVNSRVKRSHA